MAVKTITPTDAELKAVIGTWNTSAEAEADGYLFREKYDLTKPELGEIVVVHSHGRYRRGIVVSVGLTNAKVALTTPTAVEDALRYGHDLMRVKGKPVPFYLVGRKAPAATEVPAVEVTEEPEVPAVEIEAAHGEALKINEVVDEERAIELEIPEVPEIDQAEELTLNSQDCKVDTESKDEPEEDEMSTETQTAPETETTDAPAENHTGSAVVALIEKVWARIRADHPELPEVVIITGSGLVGASKWGHFRPEGWKVKTEGQATHKHELFLAGEALAKGARQVLQTMLHEAAHTLARVRDLQDTSRQGRWHNATFRKLAEELGLEHKGSRADAAHGFSFVTLTEEIGARYADLLEELDREIRLVCHLPLWLGGSSEDEETEGGEKIGKAPKGEDEEGKKAQSGNLKATCQCEEPNIIRLSRKVLDKGIVRCDECEELFTAE